MLGIGGLGVVIAATHLQLEQRVAVKFMHDADELVDLRRRKDRLGAAHRIERRVAEHLTTPFVSRSRLSASPMS